MSFAVALFGAAIAGLGVLGCLRPDSLIRFVQASWRPSTGLYLAIAIRVVFGLVLLAAAGESRFPGILRVLGVVALAAAAILPLIGRARLQRFVQWWIERPAVFVRAWAVAAAAFGAFLLYAVS